jgi:hypothetical protein
VEEGKIRKLFSDQNRNRLGSRSGSRLGSKSTSGRALADARHRTTCVARKSHRRATEVQTPTQQRPKVDGARGGIGADLTVSLLQQPDILKSRFGIS